MSISLIIVRYLFFFEMLQGVLVGDHPAAVTTCSFVVLLFSSLEVVASGKHNFTGATNHPPCYAVGQNWEESLMFC